MWLRSAGTEGMFEVDGIGIDASSFVSVGVGDGVADVAGECVLLCGRGWWWVVLGGDGCRVNVGAVDRCHRGGRAGPGNC